MIFNIFKDIYRLLNKKLISLYIWFFIYSFSTSLNDNFFICSYLKNTFFLNEELNSTTYLSAILLFILFCLKSKTTINKHISKYNIIIEFLKISYILKIFNSISTYYIITFNLNKFQMFFIFLTNYYKSYVVNNLIVYLYNLINGNLINWYPIYKTHSIYGFYRSTRFNNIDIKNENLKRIKS